MVTLNTLLLACIIVAPVASVATVAFFLLLGTYLSAKEIKKATKNDCDEDGQVLTLPMSALQGMGGGRMPTQADMERAQAAIAHFKAAQGQAEGGGADVKKAEYVPGEGAYI